MALGYQIVLFAHLIGFAALLGGCLAQLRTDIAPEVNLAMLYGAWLELLTGLGLVVLIFLQGQPLSYVEYSVKLVLTVVTLILVAKNRKFRSIPGGVLLIIATLALITAGLALFWP
jgi:hypothetical protein